MRPKIRDLLVSQISRLRDEGWHGADIPAPSGMFRGLEVLGSAWDEAILRSCVQYRWQHGRNPNLLTPTTFTEKQLLFKFFAPIPELSPSDKLRSPAYLPPEFRSLARLPHRPFIYDTAELPDDDALPAGTYFLKSNHGSGTNLRLRFPLDPVSRRESLWRAKKWLTMLHSPVSALWWYETMPRNVYLEEDLGSEMADAPDWKFFVCNGRVEIFQVDVDRNRDHVQTIYDRDGNFISSELYFKSGEPIEMPEALPKMISVAEAIGKNFDFIRVDLFLKDGQVYLGETALVPNGGNKRIRSPALDERLGAAWSAPWMGKVPIGYPNSHYSSIRTFDWTW